MKILRMPDGEPNGGSWLATLPEDMRANPSLKDVPDVPTLAKRFIDTKALVGADKILRPNDKWGDKEWGEFFAAAGRPDSPDKYEAYSPEVPPELAEFDEIKTLGDQLKEVRKFAHELGLNPAQAKKMQERFASLGLEGGKMKLENMSKSRTEAETALKKEWGDKWDENIAVANKAVETFGGNELRAYLESSKLGNHPQFVKAMAKVGRAMMEDKALAARSGFSMSDPAAARAEIEQMKSDAATMEKYWAGDKPTVERWRRLQQVAAQGK